MKKHKRILAVFVLLLAVVVLASWYLHRHVPAVLDPAGPIAEKERNLMVFCLLLSAVVVIPVFTMLGMFVWRYREGNQKAKYAPDLESNNLVEAIWWLVPTVIITIIGIVIWNSSYALDPFKPLSSTKKTMDIQVVALDWKWLFIYPGQHVASVNVAAVPAGTPVDFELTSDTVMTSFWAPQLAGQMYAMPGMQTQLNLEASKTGNFHGVAANISGSGFAGMTFTVKSMSQSNYDTWIANAKHSGRSLNASTYASLSRPSSYVQPSYYGSVAPGLYDTILMKYMMTTDGGNNVTATAAGVSAG